MNRNEKIADILQRLQNQDGLKILSYRLEQISIITLQVDCIVIKEQPFNLLEEFILRSAELTPRPSLEELAEMLGLDPIFIHYGVNNLDKQGIIRQFDVGFTVTPEGKKAIERGVYPVESTETIYLSYMPEAQRIWVAEEQNLSRKKGTHVEVDLDEANLNQMLGTGFDFQEVKSIQKIIAIEQHQVDYLVILAYTEESEQQEADVKIEVLTCNLETGKHDSRLYEAFKRTHSSDEWIHLFDIKGFEPIPVNEDQITTTTRIQPSSITIEPFRVSRVVQGQAVFQTFLTYLRKTQRFALFFSPWLHAADNHLIEVLQELAKNKVIVFIGWGTTENQPKQALSEKWLKTLASIKTKEDLPAVHLIRVDNFLKKDVVIDARTALIGSYYYLSFRPELSFRLRGEKLNIIQDQELVTKVYEAQRQELIRAIELREWPEALQEGNFNKLLRCVLTLVFMGEATKALKAIHRLSVDTQITPKRLKYLFSAVAFVYIANDLGDIQNNGRVREILIQLRRHQFDWVNVNMLKRLLTYIDKSQQTTGRPGPGHR